MRDHCHYTGKYSGAAHSICNLRYKTPKEILVVFHNCSSYDYHFIIKQLAKEFDGQLECLRENTKLDNGKTITYKLKFNDSFRLMPTSLSSFVDNVEIENANLSVILLSLKIMNHITNATNVKKYN